jgi:large subunit ribosomal protein L32
MAVPKKKVSKSRKNTRRAVNWRIKVPEFSNCPECGEPKLAHNACTKCGKYKNRQVLAVKSES